MIFFNISTLEMVTSCHKFTNWTTQINLLLQASFVLLRALIYNRRSDINGISIVADNRMEALKLQTIIVTE